MFGQHFFHRGFLGVNSLTFEVNLLLLLFLLLLVVICDIGIHFRLIFSIFILRVITKHEKFSFSSYRFKTVLVDCLFLVFNQC